MGLARLSPPLYERKFLIVPLRFFRHTFWTMLAFSLSLTPRFSPRKLSGQRGAGTPLGISTVSTVSLQPSLDISRQLTMLVVGIGINPFSTMFLVSEFRNRKPRTYGAVLVVIALLVYLAAFAIVSSASYKAHRNDIQSGLLFLPFGLTLLSAAWGSIAILYILIGSKLNQLSSWMRSISDIETFSKSTGVIPTALRVLLMFIFLLAYGFIVFPLTFILYRALFHFRVL
jgi:hypothetical protein